MAVIKAVSSKAGIGQALDYVTKDEKTEKKLVSGLNCEPDTAKEEMQATKELWGKTEGRTYKHFVQSFAPEENIEPEQAHRIACRMAVERPEWKGFEVLIATHQDKDHIHSHFIVNSVSFEDGHKLQQSRADLQNMKDMSDEICRQQGFHITEKGKTFSGEVREETVAWKKETYQLLKQAEQGKVKSYVQDIALAVLDCKETATSRETFIRLMNERGYGVDWKDSHKYITYTDLAREQAGEKACKIRNNKLEKYYNMDFGKEEMERGFTVNARSRQTTERAREQLNVGTDRPAEPGNIGIAGTDIGAFLEMLNADERASAEKRDHSGAERANREAERERLGVRRERAFKTYHARNRDYDIEH